MEAKRFRITLATLDDRRFTYHVCSCLDERKALVIASEVHHQKHSRPDDRVYEVIEVVRVDQGEGPQGVDLVDRAEW